MSSFWSRRSAFSSPERRLKTNPAISCGTDKFYFCFTLKGCNGGNTTAMVFTDAGELTVNVTSCVTATATSPSDRSEAVHVWSKPLPGGALAVLLIADHWLPMPSVELELGWLDLPDRPTVEAPRGGRRETERAAVAEWGVRDVWRRKDLGAIPVSGSVPTGDLGVHDSRLYTLTPTSAATAAAEAAEHTEVRRSKIAVASHPGSAGCCVSQQLTTPIHLPDGH